MTPQRVFDHVERHHDRFLRELKEFVRFPSVSSQPKRRHDVRRCAAWLAEHLRTIGLPETSVIETQGNPIVVSRRASEADAPTVLIYGHYDVVPADPLAEWRTPPFAPEVRGGNLYGRGACDDKGQLFTHLKAIESYLQTGTDVPVNLKLVFEGEEETGSPHFRDFVATNKHPLGAEVALVSDTMMLGPERPAITYAERGLLSMELEVRGPAKDLHSGNFGGAVANPIEILCSIVGNLQDRQGRVAVPGFYSDVRQCSSRERGYMARTGPSDLEIFTEAEVVTGRGEDGYSAYERTTIRPALTVNGITGGYQKRGGKAIIPSHALAKFSFRLVPDQEPDDIERLVRRRIESLAPASVSTRLRTLAKAKPAIINRRQPFLTAAAKAYRAGFRHRPVMVRSGGTIPVVSIFEELLGIPTILMGFGSPSDRIHGPNEKLSLENFFRGIRTSIAFLTLAGEISRMHAAVDLQGDKRPSVRCSGD